MKRYLFFLLLVFAGLKGYSQTYPLPQPKAIWSEYFVILIPYSASGSSIYYIDDTVMCGYTYARYCGCNQGDSLSCDTGNYWFYTRYDNRKVYYMENDSCGSQEDLIYDFSLNIGDTFPPLNAIVDTTYVIALANGQQRKYLHLTDINSNNIVYEWVDGIGNINTGLLPKPPVCIDCWWGFICHKDTTGLVYQNSGPFMCEELICLGQPLSISSYSPTICSGYNISSNGASDGTINLTVFGGLPPYTYLWNPTGATTEDFSNIPAGTYTVIVSDANNDSITDSIVLTEPIIAVTTTQTSTSTCSACDGTATVSASSGTPPYSYLWNTIPVQTNDSLAGLCAGVYTVVVTDSNGFQACATVEITQPQPNVLTLSMSVGHAMCGNLGVANVNVSGGASPYTYQWSNGQTTSYIDNLIPGNYCVTVTDTNGCYNSDCVIVLNLPGTTINSIVTTGISCNGICDDTATAYVSGGDPPYNYSWYDASMTLISLSNMISGLCAGTYYFEVIDGLGCTDNQTVTITEPPQLSLVIDSITPSTCSFGNGGACVSITGGTLPYVFPFVPLWDDAISTTSNCITSGFAFAGVYNPIAMDTNGCTATIPVVIPDIPGPTIDSIVTTDVICAGDANGTAEAFATGNPSALPLTYQWEDDLGTPISNITFVSGLSGGVYTVTVTDNNGCVTSGIAVIFEPTPIAGTILSSDNPGCDTCDGSITVMAGGGTSPYTYLWISNGQTTPTATGLCAGTQIVLITDANGCVTTNSGSLTAIFEVIPTVTDISCFGACDGAISLNVSGGTPPFTYSWTGGSGLCAGVYPVTVTDMNGCVATQSITVNEPSPLTATGTGYPSTCGNNNGVAIVAPSGGTQPYTYLWDDPSTSTNDTVTGLSANTYNVLITDVNGCTFLYPIIVVNIPGPVIDSTSSTDITCNGICDGSAMVTVSGGTLPLTYLWLPGGQTTPTATGLCAGTQTITVTDLNGCIVIDSVIINEPDILEVIPTVTDVSCFGACDGTISLNVIGGTPGFTYSWTGGSGLCAGTYPVTVTDMNGCVATRSIMVNEPDLLVTSSDTTICAGASTTLTASASGGNGGPYTYTWLNDGSTDSTLTVSPTTDSTFTVVVSDGGCSINDTTSTIVVVEVCSGVDEPDALKGIFVYPNPNTGEFVIEILAPKAQDVQIKIVNVLGQEIYTEIVAISSVIFRKQVDMASYPRGIYTLQVITDERAFNKKVIVE